MCNMETRYNNATNYLKTHKSPKSFLNPAPNLKSQDKESTINKDKEKCDSDNVEITNTNEVKTTIDNEKRDLDEISDKVCDEVTAEVNSVATDAADKISEEENDSRWFNPIDDLLTLYISNNKKRKRGL